MHLFPKLTEEDKGYLYLSLLVEGRAASAGSDHIQSLCSAVKAYNLVYIITQWLSYFCQFSELVLAIAGFSEEGGGAGQHGVVHTYS